jgi:hypothetical protein
VNFIQSGIVLLIGILIALPSCTDEQNSAQQYGDTMVQTHKNAKTFGNRVNVQQVQKSIQEFHAANNRYPADLNELSAFNGITLRSDNYDYDSATGVLTEKSKHYIPEE